MDQPANPQAPANRTGNLFMNRGLEDMRTNQRVTVEFTGPFPSQPHITITSHGAPSASWVESFSCPRERRVQGLRTQILRADHHPMACHPVQLKQSYKLITRSVLPHTALTFVATLPFGKHM